jgi:hypothetical protein
MACAKAYEHLGLKSPPRSPTAVQPGLFEDEA